MIGPYIDVLESSVSGHSASVGAKVLALRGFTERLELIRNELTDLQGAQRDD